MRGLTAAFIAMLVLGVGTAYAVMEPVSLIGVSRDALASSLNDEEETSDRSFTWDTACTSLGGGMWRCNVPRSDSGSGQRYEVRVDDEGCWEAGEWRPGDEPAQRSSMTRGCIGFLDATGLAAN